MPTNSLTQRVAAGTAGDAWAPGPLRPQLAEGAIHVWRADLKAMTDDLAELLDPEERARAERILGEGHRQLWARSRGVLRVLLGRYLQGDGRTLRFVTRAHGKLALTDDLVGVHAPLSFNLSHSGGWRSMPLPRREPWVST